ncbi:MAG: carbohydrate-binding domain-containing protein [Lachnospiraceae bacterium]|nr:carbohydrate-binding domain-containing protein [Lachnospiraceae bacterium]
MAVLLSACSQSGVEGTAEKSSSSGTVSGSSASSEEVVAETVEDVASVSDAAAEILQKEQFTERDLSGEISEDAINISLKDSGTEISGTADASSEYVKVDGSTVTIRKEGTYLISGTLSDGMLIVDAGEKEKVQLVLKGADIHSNTSAALYVKQADKVFVTLSDGGENTLSSGDSYVAIDENNIDGAVFSKDDITFNGSGSLSVEAPAGHGIVSKDDLKFTGGTYQISAGKHGAVANDSIRVAEGTLTITSEEKDGFHSKGYLYIHGGTFDVTAADDGMHADGNFLVDDGKVQITKSYEGLEGQTITIAGGKISVTSSDDGLNAAGGNDSSGMDGKDDWRGGGGSFAQEDAIITIAGGVLEVDAEGDGIDSNGYFYMNGGTVYVAGPTGRGNGALSSGVEAVAHGGTLIAAGTDDMAENFSENSTQGSILFSVSGQAAGSTIELLTSDGKSLVSWEAKKSYSSVVISTPDIAKGQTYTVRAGNAEEEVTMENLIYGEGNNFGHGGGGRGFGRDGKGFGRGRRFEDDRGDL